MTSGLQIKRAHDKPNEQDGSRFLVERLWPRGVTKPALTNAAWLRDAAPSSKLRRWFHHDPLRWNESRRRYFAELKGHKDALSPILEAAHNGT